MTQTNPAIVKVGATVEAQVEPDIALFAVRFGGTCKTQEACAADFADELEKIRATLDAFDIADELKTSDYSTLARRGRRKGAIDSYEYFCWGTLRLTRAEHDIRAIWQALQDCGCHATFTLGFELDDERAAERELITQAVDQARSNAEALAAATGMRLGDVLEVRHNRGDGALGRVFSCFGAPDGASDSATPDFNPEPIEVECHVDIDWQMVP